MISGSDETLSNIQTHSPSHTNYPIIQRRNAQTKNIISHLAPRTLEEGRATNLNDQLEALKKQCEEYRDHIKNLSTENFELKKAEERHSLLNSEFSNQNSVDQTINAQLVESINNLASEKTQLDQRVSELNTEIITLNSELYQQKQTTEQYIQLLANQTEKNAAFKARSDETINNLVKELDIKSAELTEVKEQILENDAKLKTMAKELAETHQTILILQGENEGLVAQNSDLQARLDTSEKLIAEAREYNSKILSDSKEIKIKFNDLVDKYELLSKECDDYKRLSKSQNEQIMELKSQINNFTSENTSLASQNLNLTTLVDDLSEELKSNQNSSDVQPFVDKLRESEQQIQYLTSEIEELRSLSTFKEGLINDLNEKLTNLASQRDQLISNVQLVSSAQQTTAKSYQDFSDNILAEMPYNDLSPTLASLNQENNELRQKIDELKDEIKALLAFKDSPPINTAQSDELAQLQLDNSRLAAQNSVLTSYKDRAEQEIENLKDSLRETESTLLYEKNRLSALKEKQKYSKKKTKSSPSIEAKEAEIDKLTREADNYKTRINELMAQGTQIAQENTSLNAQLAHIKNELEVSQRETKTLNDLLNNSGSRNQFVINNDEHLSYYKDQYNHLSREISGYISRISSLAAENESLKTSSSYQSHEVDRLTKELQTLSSTVTQLNSELSLKKSDLTELKLSLNQKDQTIHSLQLQIEQLTKKIAAKETLIQSLNAQIAENNARLSSLKQDHKNYNDQINTLQRKSESIAQYSSTDSEIKEILLSLKDQIALNQQNNTYIHQKMAETEKQNESLKSHIARLQEDLSTKNNELTQLSSEVTNYNNMNQLVQLLTEKFNSSVSSEKDMLRIQEEYKDLETQSALQLQEISILKQKNTEHERSINDLHSQNSYLRNEYTNLSTSFSSQIKEKDNFIEKLTNDFNRYLSTLTRPSPVAKPQLVATTVQVEETHEPVIVKVPTAIIPPEAISLLRNSLLKIRTPQEIDSPNTESLIKRIQHMKSLTC